MHAMYDKHRIDRFLSNLFQANEVALARLFDPSNVPDRVVQTILDDRIVTDAQVKPVYNVWLSLEEVGRGKKRLWRMVAEAVPKRAEQIRAAAARVYAFDDAMISTNEAVRQMEAIFVNWSIEQWRELRDLKCLPIRLVPIEDSATERFVFASHDPTRVGLRPMIEDLGIEDYELCYTPEAVMDYLGEQLEAIIKLETSRPAPIGKSTPGKDGQIKAA